VVNEAATPNGPAVVQGLLQGVEAGLGAARHPPADDAKASITKATWTKPV
jgi:hypothetical protein